MLHTLRTFQNPPSQYRSKPFWAWNGDLDEPELRRQIRLFRRMGMGGFFMHARTGLATPYLGEQWHRLVGSCVEEAARQKMEAWIYDEDRWPSGSAGGRVTQDTRYRMRHLVVHRVPTPSQVPAGWAPLAFFSVIEDGVRVRDVIPLGRRPARVGRGRTLLACSVVLNEPSSWFNGNTYIDAMNRQAVREFIRLTHQSYRRWCGRFFGKVIPGIFTDEPFKGWACQPFKHAGGNWGIAWTPRLVDVFRTRHGYDLLPHLLELFYDVEGEDYRQVRYDYHECITHLYTDAFVSQISRWCDRNKLMLTGHIPGEEYLYSQVESSGECMRFCEHLHVPGMDLLTQHARIYAAAKQISSVARQLGRRWRMTETYGCTGWDFPLEGHKALGDWQVALGINLRVPHLSFYTLAGEAKRDYPASISYQSPWWECYDKVEDYFARVHVLMSRGQEIRDILVIHPVESVWLLVRKHWKENPRLRQLDERFSRLAHDLLEQHLDFDYGSEDFMARQGRVVMTGLGPELKVGQASYRVVIVPSMLTIRDSTLRLLRQFRQAGGRVIWLGDPASYVAGAPSQEPAHLAAGCVRLQADPTPAVLAAAAGPMARRVSITSSDGHEAASVLYLLREDREALYLFVCNTGHSAAHRRLERRKDVGVRQRVREYRHLAIRVGAMTVGKPQEWCPATGRVYAADAAKDIEGGWILRTSLGRLASRLFVLPKVASRRRLPLIRDERAVRRKRLASKAWSVTLNEPNVLVLDRPRHRIEHGAWQRPADVLDVDRAVRQAMHLPPRGGEMAQPWAQPAARNPRQAQVELEYQFELQEMVNGPLELALEQPERYRVWLNGISVTMATTCGWWTDRSMRRIPLNAACLRRGMNALLLQCDYDQSAGLETVYLLGGFGVRVSGTRCTITGPVRQLTVGDWGRQGLPFYGGNVTYRVPIRCSLQDRQRAYIRVAEFDGTGVRLWMGGQEVGVMAWPPYELEITEQLKKGEVDMGVEVLGHRRNSHGPLHYVERSPIWTGPPQFVAKVSDQYQLVSCGLRRSPILVVKES